MDFVLTDEQIARLGAAERAELIERLARPSGELGSGAGWMRRTHRLRLAVLVVSAASLVPWGAYLSITLPRHYDARNWTAAWVGFDAVVALLLAVTVLLAVQRRMLVVLTALASAVLLLTDAWFDVLTSAPWDRGWAVVAAAFGELPLALVLLNGSLTVLRLTAARFYRIEPTAHIWAVRFRLPRREGFDL